MQSNAYFGIGIWRSFESFLIPPQYGVPILYRNGHLGPARQALDPTRRALQGLCTYERTMGSAGPDDLISGSAGQVYVSMDLVIG